MPEIQKQMDSADVNPSSSTLTVDGVSGMVKSRSSSNPTSKAIIEKFFNDYLTNMLAQLLLTPDNPEQGVLYLLTGVQNLVSKYVSWENTEIKFNLLLNIVIVFGALKQENYLYHVDNGIYRKNIFNKVVD